MMINLIKYNKGQRFRTAGGETVVLDSSLSSAPRRFSYAPRLFWVVRDDGGSELYYSSGLPYNCNYSNVLLNPIYRVKAGRRKH